MTYDEQIKILNDLGITLNTDGTITVDPHKCNVSIAYVGEKVAYERDEREVTRVQKENELDDVKDMILYYPGPEDYGQQQFKFNLAKFYECYQAAKFKHVRAKDEYTSFQESFFGTLQNGGYYPKASRYVKYIFEIFNISPTITQKAVHMNKKIARRLKLEPSRRQILSQLGIYHVKRNSSPNSLKTAYKSNLSDEELTRIYTNMQIAVEKAAMKQSYQYVYYYIEAVKELKGCTQLSRRATEKIENEFIRKVRDRQKQGI